MNTIVSARVIVTCPGRNFVTLKIETQQGVYGLGDATLNGRELAVASYLTDHVVPCLIGRDAHQIEDIWQFLYRGAYWRRGPITMTAIAAVDMALWDIKAKLAGEPLWRLLGGRDRFVPGYASGLDIALDDDELARFYSEMAGRGFTSGKLKGGRNVASDIRRLGIIGDALRVNIAEPGLMLDANESWNLKQAVRYVSQIEEVHDLVWIEEPIRRWDAGGHARLSASVRAAVATGENLTGLEQYRPHFDAGGIDVVQAAATWGVTHFLRVSIAAHSRDLPVSPVGLTANAAVAHAAAAVPNHLSAEIQDVGSPFGVSIDQEYADGGIVLGDQPGVGVCVDEALIATFEHAEPGWGAEAGPHVRPARAGLQLSGKPESAA